MEFPYNLKEPSINTSAHLAGKFCFNVQNNEKWIVDSGATDYICSKLQLFAKRVRVEGKPHLITIPDRTQVKVEIVGTMNLLNGIVLKNVYVPKFCFNLISVSKLVKDFNSHYVWY